MAVSSAARQAADEEARAEVEVLSSRLDKTNQLTKKIQASLNRLETSGKSVQDAIGPIYGNTQRLQVLGRNIDGMISAIDRIRQPSDTKHSEEEIIRAGPDNIGLAPYVSSLKRVIVSLGELQKSNLKANKQAAADLERLLRNGNQQLEAVFERILQESAGHIEVMHFITKGARFPAIPQERAVKLGVISSHLSASTPKDGSESSTARSYASIRGQYLVKSLANLAFSVVDQARKRNPGTVYVQGESYMKDYAAAMQGLFMVEFDIISSLFPQNDWARVFNTTCREALSECQKSLKNLDAYIRANLTTACYLGFEIIEIISNLSTHIDSRTGELKPLFATALRPIRDTCKSSLAELLLDTQRQINNLQALPIDGAKLDHTTEVMTRLQTMVNFIRPVSSIMISLGDGNWKTINPASGSQDIIPTLKSFDVGADGRELFAHYCNDTIDALMTGLNQRAMMILKGKLLQGAFIANNHAIVDRGIRTSELLPLMAPRMANIDVWKKRGREQYLREWDECSRFLLDSINTGRVGQRPASGSAGAIDSAAILKGLSSKEKDGVKEKFKSFNQAFEDLVQRHKAITMEREVREMLARAVQSTIEPLYFRFWDRYHEVDKGRGKYIKWDKNEFSKYLNSLA